MSRLHLPAARLAGVALTFLPCALLLARSAQVVAARPESVPAGVRTALLFAQGLAIALGAAALLIETAATRRRELRGSAWAPFGRFLMLCVAGWLGAVLTQAEAYEAWRVDAALATVLALHAAVVLAEPRLARRLPARARRVLWIVGLEAAALVVATEFALRVAARWTDSQLLQSAIHVASDVVREAKLPAHARYGAGTLNARGFNDEEFGPRVEGRARVLVIGDSFSTGIVPYTHHYTTVAERELPDVELLNVGVPRIGPYEYLHLYRHECQDLDPDLIVVALFVGNDVSDARTRRQGSSAVVRLFDRRYCLSIEVPRRLWRLRGQALPALSAGAGVFEPLTVELAEARAPHLLDPSLEQPTLDETQFRRIEAERLAFLARTEPRSFDEALIPLLELRDEARPVPVVVLILPDMFQVEDPVGRDALTATGVDPADRDRAQRELARACAAVGLPSLDTLPALRAVDPEADGRRHLYHQGDTHFNARGNRVVGLELARLVREHLPSR